MPGICGVVDFEAARSRGRLQELRETTKRMVAAMCYEKAYRCDLVSSDALGVCVGRVGAWTKLSHAESINHSATLRLITTGEPCTDDRVASGNILTPDTEAVGMG